MNIEEARKRLILNTDSPYYLDAIDTLYHLAIERDEALRQAQAEHEKLETLRNILKEKNQ